MTTRLLGYTSLLMLLVATYGIFFVARSISGEGDAGRIIYFHVPMAWVAFLAFFIVFGASIAYLRTSNPRWDHLGRASAEVGVVFTTLVLITGAIWGLITTRLSCLPPSASLCWCWAATGSTCARGSAGCAAGDVRLHPHRL